MEKKCQIKIYSYKDKNPKGYLYHAAYPEAKPFWSLTQLLFLLDELPETEEEITRFCPEIRGALAELNITSSEDWKGQIAWAKKSALPFDGVMEFVRVLDSVFAEKKGWRPEKEMEKPGLSPEPEEGKELEAAEGRKDEGVTP